MIFVPQRGPVTCLVEGGRLTIAARPHLQTLLREVQTLCDQRSTEDEASPCATAGRLLRVYEQLRSPSLPLL